MVPGTLELHRKLSSVEKDEGIHFGGGVVKVVIVMVECGERIAAR